MEHIVTGELGGRRILHEHVDILDRFDKIALLDLLKFNTCRHPCPIALFSNFNDEISAANFDAHVYARLNNTQSKPNCYCADSRRFL